MKARSVFLTATATLLAGCAQISGTSMQPGFNDSELRAAEKAVERALESSDQTVWVYHYTEDAVFVSPGAPTVQGRNALLQMAKAMRPLSALVITPLRTEASGNVAAVYGRVSWVSGAQTSAATATNVRLIIVWRKEQDGQWRVAQELLHAEPAGK